MRKHAVYVALGLLIVTLCIAGCSSSNDKQASDTSVISGVSVNNKSGYEPSGLEVFFEKNGYDNYKIETDVGITYYWYNNYGVVIDENDIAKRVIKDNKVYIADDTQYWESVYNFDDDPISIKNVIIKDKAEGYRLVNGWYFSDPIAVDESAVSIYKYKIDGTVDNKITVAKVEYIDRGKEPYNNEVIEEITYTITEIKSSDEVPVVNFTELEEVSVLAPDEWGDTDEWDDTDEWEEVDEWEDIDELEDTEGLNDADELKDTDELEDTDEWEHIEEWDDIAEWEETDELGDTDDWEDTDVVDEFEYIEGDIKGEAD